MAEPDGFHFEEGDRVEIIMGTYAGSRGRMVPFGRILGVKLNGIDGPVVVERWRLRLLARRVEDRAAQGSSADPAP